MFLNPCTGKLHGFESSNIKQRRCAEGDREAGTLASLIARDLAASAIVLAII